MAGPVWKTPVKKISPFRLQMQIDGLQLRIDEFFKAGKWKVESRHIMAGKKEADRMKKKKSAAALCNTKGFDRVFQIQKNRFASLFSSMRKVMKTERSHATHLCANPHRLAHTRFHRIPWTREVEESNPVDKPGLKYDRRIRASKDPIAHIMFVRAAYETLHDADFQGSYVIKQKVFAVITATAGRDIFYTNDDPLTACSDRSGPSKRRSLAPKNRGWSFCALCDCLRFANSTLIDTLE
ncbi:hypothetical protein BDZ88DRAFT_176216 [Geranomyces variabilis]|nr:hypothetical protein BDZ88DRAFT_176216 [Geranomyces variabilis]KAJ3138964.1 hypothetical protein HDU90_000870 [Geranomyces variabilis]